jgi:hypothetical protein
MSTISSLLDLAPPDLPVVRALRYEGNGLGLRLPQFAPDDQALLRRLYQAVRRVGDLTRTLAPSHPRVGREVAALDAEGLAEAAAALGRATALRGDAPELLPRVVHDVRGGGLPHVLAAAAALRAGPPDAALQAAAAAAARDHAAMVRNAVADLDATARHADEARRAHYAADFARRWDGAALPDGGALVTVRADCGYDGGVCARGLEASSLQRVLYNHLNNAAHFAASGEVGLDIFPVGSAGLVRWVVANDVTARQRAWLQRSTGGDLRELYRGAPGEDGREGLGLPLCAEFVAACFGLDEAKEAVEKGYLGATLSGGRYHAWFHWPAYTPPRPEDAD